MRQNASCYVAMIGSNGILKKEIEQGGSHGVVGMLMTGMQSPTELR